ncbi:MAG: hypothetical protein LBF22_02040 [Deltaproteobacteria bacterium]|jgi:hypothetical protein|nr:hypothetical protein [Deltaproteobacteria bacterium]
MSNGLIEVDNILLDLLRQLNFPTPRDIYSQTTFYQLDELEKKISNENLLSIISEAKSIILVRLTKKKSFSLKCLGDPDKAVRTKITDLIIKAAKHHSEYSDHYAYHLYSKILTIDPDNTWVLGCRAYLHSKKRLIKALNDSKRRVEFESGENLEKAKADLNYFIDKYNKFLESHGYKNNDKIFNQNSVNDVTVNFNSSYYSLYIRPVKGVKLYLKKGTKKSAGYALDLLQDIEFNAYDYKEELPFVNFYRANAFFIKTKYKKALFEANLALKENPLHFEAQLLIAKVMVKHYNMMAAMAYPDKYTSSGFKKKQKKSFSEIDKLIDIFNRLSNAGFFYFTFIKFAPKLFSLAETIKFLRIPYDYLKITNAILNVPQSKIFMSGFNRSAKKISKIYDKAKSFNERT